MPDSQACPFCAPELDRLIASTDNSRVLWDQFPVSPGHALVVPKRHVERWRDLHPAERSELLAGIDTAMAAIESAHRPDGYNVGLNDGAAAGQTVMHLHLHVIPRYTGDSPDPRGGIRWVVPGKARYWTGGDGPR